VPLETDLEAVVVVLAAVADEAEEEAAAQGGEEVPLHGAGLEGAAEAGMMEEK
jgi:hypothetical protein